MSKKTALITGASSGIGAASAVQLAKDGFDLIIAARRKEKLEEVAESCRAEGANVLVCPTDTSDETAVKALFETVKANCEKLDFYFCNQGVLMKPTRFENQTLDQYYLVSENNFKSAFLCLVNCINLMKEQGGGNILVTASSSGIRPEIGFGLYSASKHAVVGLTKEAAIESGRFGIRINCLCPGGVDTPMVTGPDAINNMNSEEAQAAMERYVDRAPAPLLKDRTIATVDEISGMVSFMASDRSTFMTGATLSIDCGITQ